MPDYFVRLKDGRTYTARNAKDKADARRIVARKLDPRNPYNIGRPGDVTGSKVTPYDETVRK